MYHSPGSNHSSAGAFTLKTVLEIQQHILLCLSDLILSRDFFIGLRCASDAGMQSWEFYVLRSHVKGKRKQLGNSYKDFPISH